MPEEFNHEMIYDLLGRYLASEATSEEVEQVESWLNESASNRQEFEAFKLIWKETGAIEPAHVDVDRAWQNVRSKITRSDAVVRDISTSKPLILRRQFQMLAVAATVLVAVGAYFIFQWFGSSSPAQPTMYVAETDVLEVDLSDGSIATLNAGSEMEFVEKDDQRLATMTGEVFFDVERDEEKPFFIDAGAVQVEVLGTSFNVKAIDGEETVEVIVEEGMVRFFDGNEEIQLVAGERGTYFKSSQTFQKDVAELNELFWKSKTLVFKQTDLTTVVATLNEVYSVNIAIGNAALANCNLTATFKDESIESILEIIASTFGIDVVGEGVNIELQGDGC